MRKSDRFHLMSQYNVWTTVYTLQVDSLCDVSFRMSNQSVQLVFINTSEIENRM